MIIQELIFDSATPWQLHNCKISQQTCEFDVPIPFLTHYGGLDDTTKEQYPLTFAQIKAGERLMDSDAFAQSVGIDSIKVKKPWQIKYLGCAVIACMPIKLAIRLHLTNTAKSAQTVYAPSRQDALMQESKNWGVFGVVDVLYKGDDKLVSMAYDELVIEPKTHYQALPSEHSLAVLAIINEHKNRFGFIDTAIAEQIIG